MTMRIELDKPLSRKTLRQSLKMLPNNVKRIKIICGSGILDIDTIVSNNDTLFLCTDSQQTIDFLDKIKKNNTITCQSKDDDNNE